MLSVIYLKKSTENVLSGENPVKTDALVYAFSNINTDRFIDLSRILERDLILDRFQLEFLLQSAEIDSASKVEISLGKIDNVINITKSVF